MNSDLLIIGKRTLQKEAEALLGFVDQLGESFVAACELLFECKGTVLLTGMGKSGLVARKWASTFSSTGTKSYFINPAEAPHGDLGILHSQDVVCALSLSGETEELEYLLKHARELKIKVIAVTGDVKSSLAKGADITLLIQVNEEACPLNLAPMTSTTLMMALGDAIAATLMQKRNFSQRDFARLHPGGTLGRRLWLRVDTLMHRNEEIPKVTAEDSLENVLLEMTKKRLGFAIVMNTDQILGVITDGDLRRFFQKHGLKAHTVARELMTASPQRISSDALAIEARELMETKKIQQLPVFEGEKLVGVLHIQDLLQAKVL